MSKYTPVQLRDMAQMFLVLERRGDFRCLRMRTMLMMVTGMSDREIDARIRGFAGSWFQI